jgi:hypothetical protein
MGRSGGLTGERQRKDPIAESRNRIPCHGSGKATMPLTTEEVLEQHVKCFFEGDLEGIVSDYSTDAVLFTPKWAAEGPRFDSGILPRLD